MEIFIFDTLLWKILAIYTKKNEKYLTENEIIKAIMIIETAGIIEMEKFGNPQDKLNKSSITASALLIYRRKREKMKF